MKQKLKDALRHAAQGVLGLPIGIKPVDKAETLIRVAVITPTGEQIDIGHCGEYNGGLTQGRSHNPTLAKLISAVHNNSLNIDA